jgi:hypothetical protein
MARKMPTAATTTKRSRAYSAGISRVEPDGFEVAISHPPIGNASGKAARQVKGESRDGTPRRIVAREGSYPGRKSLTSVHAREMF